MVCNTTYTRRWFWNWGFGFSTPFERSYTGPSREYLGSSGLVFLNRCCCSWLVSQMPPLQSQRPCSCVVRLWEKSGSWALLCFYQGRRWTMTWWGESKKIETDESRWWLLCEVCVVGFPMDFISCFELGMYMLRDFVSANCFARASARMVHVCIQRHQQ